MQACVSQLGRRLRRDPRPSAVLQGAGRQLRRYRDAIAARRIIKEVSPSLTSYAEAIEFLQGFHLGDVELRIGQVESEIVQVCELIELEQPKRLLEIGTNLGGTLFLFCRAAPTDAHLVSIDLPYQPAPEHPNGYLGYHESRRLVLRAFTRPSQRVSLLQRNSHDPKTMEKARGMLAGPVDFLFIDGDHAYEAVRRDWELYSPLVRPGGLVGFHDIWPGIHSGGVPEFWREVKAGRDVIEVVGSEQQDGFGIGLVRIPDQS
jgi:predicted O-methyltransferase YrrM